MAIWSIGVGTPDIGATKMLHWNCSGRACEGISPVGGAGGFGNFGRLMPVISPEPASVVGIHGLLMLRVTPLDESLNV